MAMRFGNLIGGKGGKKSAASASSSSPQAKTGTRDRAAVGRALLPTPARQASVGYTRFVYAMKVVLPALAVTLIVLVVAWPQLTREDKSFRIGIADVDVGVDENTNMVNARYVGTDDKQQPFTVTADHARDLDREGDRVRLATPKADILLEDGTWLIMSANEGIYSRAGQSLQLQGTVNLFHDSGYEFRTEQATIDLGKSEARSDVPVRGQGAFGDIAAAGMIVRDQGKTLIFTGPARAVLYSAKDVGEGK